MGGGISSVSSSSSETINIPFFMPLGGGVFFLVDRTPLEDWTMFPLVVSTACGKYLDAFEYVSPGHVSTFPLYIALSHVELAENPDHACMYLTSASALGRSYALYAESVVCLISVVWYSSNSLVGFRAKRHSLSSSFSLHWFTSRR